MSEVLRTALSGSVRLDRMPKSCVDVFVMVSEWLGLSSMKLPLDSQLTRPGRVYIFGYHLKQQLMT